MTSRFRPLHELPLFANEEEIAAALMGPGRLRQWKMVAPLLEARGLPKIDPEMGGRYVPAVRRFFDDEYRLNTAQPVPVRDGKEDLGGWSRRRKVREVPGKRKN